MYNVKVFKYNVTLSGTNGTSTVPFRNRLFDHFSNESSSLWEIDSSVSGNSSSNFVIRSKTSGVDFQMRFSPGGDNTRCLIGLDSKSQMSDASDPANGSDDLVSREWFKLLSSVGSGDFFLIETKDTVTFVTDTLASQLRHFFHVGKIIDTNFSNDFNYGMDGLGGLGTVLSGDGGGALQDVSNSTFSPSGLNMSAVKISTKSLATIRTNDSIFPREPSTTGLRLAGKLVPADIGMFLHTGEDKRQIGRLRYIHAWRSSVTNKQTISSDGQSFIVFVGGDGTGGNLRRYTLLPWEYGVEVTY